MVSGEPGCLRALLQTPERPFSAQWRHFSEGEACTRGRLDRNKNAGEEPNRAEDAVWRGMGGARSGVWCKVADGERGSREPMRLMVTLAAFAAFE